MNRCRRPQLVLVFCLAIVGSAERAAAVPEQTGSRPIEGRPFFAALSVRDAEASAAWYERVLGFSAVRRIDMPERGARIVLMRTENAFLELVEHAAARSPAEIDPTIDKIYLLRGVFKLGLLVDDLAATLDRLGALDVPLRGIVFTEPDNSFRSAQIEDPDGIVIQLFERLSD